MPTHRPIRVMRIIARLNVGGPAIHVTLLTEAMQPPDFDSTLVCGQIGEHEGDMAYLAEARGITPQYIAALGRELAPLRDMVTLFKLWRLIRQVRPDVVHTHTAKAGFVGRIAAWLARVPVRLHTFHGHVFHGYFSPAKTHLFLWLERLTARFSDRLVTISPGLRDELAHTYRIAPAEKFTIVRLGLELKPFAATPRKTGDFRAQFNIPADAPLVGIVGRVVPIKNHALFLQAAQRVREAMPDAHFVIVGDGELRVAVESQVTELGLQDAVTFTGFLRDLKPVYADMDALVISSDNEGTPVSIIEALAAGVPVVSTAVGGVPDLLNQGAYGRLTPPGDAGALAEAISATLSDDTDDQHAIQDAIIAQYDISRLVADLSTLYRDLLATKGKGPAHER
ncbi:MAG: glycosyltransferase family 4 protein [Anaerolineae bacterium]|nr:glycosyltransferase family 4 protein [Anaerolineae bacterium]